MAIYLVQHGKAYSKEENEDRPLTFIGKSDVQVTAHVLQKNGVIINKIFHSGKSRAYETADIITIYANHNGTVEQMYGLDPMDDVISFAENLDPNSNNMYVGHLPFMNKLVSYLICEDVDIPVIKFQNGGCVCMDKIDDDWVIKWSIFPGIS